MVVFGPPGWRADGQGDTAKILRARWAARAEGQATPPAT